MDNMDHEKYQTPYNLTPNFNLLEINIEILGNEDNSNSKLDTISNSADNLKNLNYNIEIIDKTNLNPSPQNHSNLNTTDKQNIKDMDSHENQNVFIKQEQYCTIKIEPYVDGENYQETLHNTQIKHSLEDNADCMDNTSQSSLQSVKTDVTDNSEQNDVVVENAFDVKLDIKEELLDEVNDRITNSLDEITKQKYSGNNKCAVKSEPEYTEDASDDGLLIPLTNKNKELTYREHSSPIEENEDTLGGPSSKKRRPRRCRSLSRKKMVEIAQSIKTKEKKKITKDNKHNQRVTKRKDISKTSIGKNKKIKSEEVDTEKAIEPMLSCNICSYTTWNNTYMDLHLFKHEENERKDQGIFPCTICDYVFQDRPSWTKHLLQHNGKNPYKCYLCGFKCEKPSVLVRHASTTHPEITRPFSCNVCDYKSANNSDIVRHTRTHTGEKPFSCKLCSYRCTDTSSLGFHMRTHTGEKPYSCKLCDYRSKCNSALTSHMRRHTGERPYTCKACDFKFANNSDRIRHMKLNTGDNFSCNLCEFNCTAKCALIKHLRSHAEVKKYNCVKCNFECSNKAYLLTHMKSHNGKNAYSCKDCEFKSDKYGKYSRHISIHTSEKILCCEVCSFSCKGQHALGRHMKAEHSEKSYSCRICGFKSWCKSDLASHLITHKCDKPYSCGQCEYTCTAGRTLKRHVQKIHVGLSEKEVII